MKKTIAITLTATLLFASAAVYAADQQQYKDLKTTNWAYESVKAMSDKDIIKGYPDGSFKPQSTVTYGEFIKMMVVAVTGEELTVAEKPHHWAYNYYQKALELNLFAEAEIDTTMLNHAIPRSDMALIISNGLGKTEVENYSEIEKIVKDVDSTTKYDYHIIKSYATGILSGYSDGSFKPKGTLTRAESALVIYRFTDESKRTPVTAENPQNTVQIIEGSVANRGTDPIAMMDLSPSTKPVEQAVKNIRGNSVFDEVKYYEVISDYPEKMSIILGRDKKREFIKMDWDGSRGMMLIKDNKILDYYEGYPVSLTDYGDGETSCYAWNRDALGYKLPDFDYFGIYSASDTMLLVANPFKNGYQISEVIPPFE